MKKLWLFLFLLPGAVACNDDKNDNGEAEQHVTCSVTAPAEGAVVDITGTMTIKGTATADIGKISNVTLKVGGKVVSEVTAVPFDYTYTFAEDQVAGELKIELSVEGDMKGSATDEVTVTLVSPDQQVTCAITEPAADTKFDIPGKITIKGEGKADVGEISKVTLTVGGKAIADVTSVPFTYDYELAADQEAGELEIVLSVEGDMKGGATDKVTVLLVVPEQHVTCAITEPVAGAEFDMPGKITIKGEGTADIGEISKVTLTVGGVAIADVTSVPFTCDYELAADQVEGDLKIELSVEGDKQGKATDEVIVKVKKAPVVNPDEFVDARDGNVYKTKKIGDQTWMAQNLAYLPQVNKVSESAKTDPEKPFYYVLNYDGNDVDAAKQTDEYKKGGVLYNWFAAMDGAAAGDREAVPSGVKGICPEGWHLPSAKEWQILSDYVASQLPVVKGEGWMDDFGDWHYEDCKNVWSALAGLEGWGAYSDSSDPDLANGPRNTFGFNAIPVGDYFPGVFQATDAHAWFWMTNYETSSYGNFGGYASLSNISYDLTISGSGKGSQSERGHSVRCLKD